MPKSILIRSGLTDRICTHPISLAIMEHSRYIDVHDTDNKAYIMKNIFKHCCFAKENLELELLFHNMQERQLFPLLYHVGCITDENLRLSLLNVVFFFANLGFDPKQENNFTEEPWVSMSGHFYDVIEHNIQNELDMNLVYLKFVCSALRLKFNFGTGFDIGRLLSMWRQIRTILLKSLYSNNRNFQRKVDALFPNSEEILNRQKTRPTIYGQRVSLQQIQQHTSKISQMEKSHQDCFLEKVPNSRLKRKRILETDIKKTLEALREMKRLKNRSLVYKEANFFEIISLRLKENTEVNNLERRLQDLESSTDL